MKSQPYTLRQGERKTQTRPIHVYVIIHGTDKYHLTNYDRDLTIEDLPATHGSDPQTFTSAQISHSSNSQRSEIGSQGITVNVGVNSSPFASQLKNYIVSAVPSRTQVIVARVNPTAAPGTLSWFNDCYVIFKGALVNLAFNRYAIQMNLVSLLMQNEGKVPRFFYQKTCQHALYSTICGVNPESSADYKLSTTLSAVSSRARFVEIANTTINGQPILGTTFQGGILKIGAEQLYVVSSPLIDGGGVRLYLSHWNTSLIANASVTIYRGCRRIVADCGTIFNNLANFGGFPYIPDVNPTLNGIRATEN